MKEIFENAVQNFIDNNLTNIKKFAGWFAKSITLNIMDENKEELRELYSSSSYMRSDIEFIEPIRMNKEYYLGYCSAYENIARKLIEEENSQEEIDIVVQQMDSLRLDKIIKFLGQNGYVKQKELASAIGISQSHLCNILKNPSIKKIGILSVQKIGKYSLYGLNKKGKQYYEDKVSNEKKQYSKKMILHILSSIFENYDKLPKKDLIESVKILDEELAKSIYETIYDFNLKNEISNKKMFYSSAYKDTMQAYIQKNKDNESSNYIEAKVAEGQADYNEAYKLVS